MTKRSGFAIASVLLILQPVFAASPRAQVKKSPAPRPAKQVQPPKTQDKKGLFDPLAKQIESGLRNSKMPSVDVRDFSYPDAHASEGPAIVKKELTDSLAKRGVAVSTAAGAFVEGSLKDVSRKSKVEVHAVLRESATHRALGGGGQLILKTWKDPVAACGKMEYVSLAKSGKPRESSPADIKFVFTEFWPERTVLGKILWNFCSTGGRTSPAAGKQGKKNPSLNDALPELQKKAWEEGGRALIIDKNETDPDNREVLRIEARVISF